MHLLEVVIMSSSINQLSMLLLRSSAVNICQCCVRFCIHHHLSVVARTFMKISLYFFQFASTGNISTFKIAATNIAVHEVELFIAYEKWWGVISILYVRSVQSSNL